MRFKSICALACLCAAMITGCAEQPASASAMGSCVFETMPTLTYGSLESEKLQVLPWNSGRCEATSLNAMAETETGFYQACALRLYYADKENLSSWIPVCSDPTCTHYGNCDSYISTGRFLVSNEKIIYEESPQAVPVMEKSDRGGFILASKNPDGTFHKVEYILEDMLVSGKSATSSLLMPDQWLCQKFELTPNGTQSGRLYCVTEDGPLLLWEQNDFDPLNPPHGIMDAASLGLYGDRYFTSGILDDSKKTVYRVMNGKLEALDVSGLNLLGSYISGDTLRFFRSGKGYYDRNLESGEELFLAPACLENSESCVLLPNCIIESTLLFPASRENRTPGMEHSLVYFDGECWCEVQLPKELKQAGSSVILAPLAITSDSILFYCMDSTPTSATYSVKLYYISLNAEEKTLEYMATIVTP